MKMLFALVLVLFLSALPALVQAQFTFTTNNGAITITKYTGPGGAVTIPSTTNGYPVTSIGPYAFYQTSAMTVVTIPVSVTSIGDGAFELCSSLVTLTIPSNVVSIGDSAFLDCNNLSSVIVSNNLATLGGARRVKKLMRLRGNRI